MRLTSKLRSTIASRVVAHRQTAERNWLTALEAEYERITRFNGAMLYEYLYTQAERDLMASASPKMFKHRADVQVALGEKAVVVRAPFGTARPVPFNDAAGHAVVHAIFEPVMIANVDKMTAAKECIADYHAWLGRQRRDMVRELVAAMTPYTTVAALEKNWPELKAFLPVEVKATAVAVSHTALNAKFGLPPKGV